MLTSDTGKDRKTRETLTESVTDRITEDIVFGGLQPGAKLRIEDLKSRYSTGASPIREALSGLVAQGFVTSETRRGFRVAEMSRADLVEITEIRTLIELKALELSIQRGGRDWEEGVVVQMARLRHAVKQANNEGVPLDPGLDGVHEDYHRSLLAACGSPRLIGLQETYYELAKRYRMLVFRQRYTQEDFLQQHEILTDVVLSRRLEASLAELRRHLRLLVTLLPADEFPDQG